MLCLTCRGLGFVGGCPTCGKVASNEAPLAEVASEELDTYAIPKYYQGNVWSKQVLLDSHKDVKAITKLEKYAEGLTRVYNLFSSGELPNKSLYVYADPGMGKLTWAYACMQQALKHGHTIVPIIDNTQFKRLSIISSDRMSSRFLKNQKYSIEDYISADVMFLTIDPDNFQGSYRTVYSVLDKRARNGKATMIISRYTLEQISLLDYSDTFSSSIVSKSEQDRNKYLAVIGGIVCQ